MTLTPEVDHQGTEETTSGNNWIHCHSIFQTIYNGAVSLEKTNISVPLSQMYAKCPKLSVARKMEWRDITYK